MLNQCNFLCRLISKLELRHTLGGTPFVKFTIAVDRDRPSQDGKWVTDYIDCIAWNKLAEKICVKYNTGDLVTVTGRLQNHTQTDSAGNQIVAAEILVLDCRKVILTRVEAASSSVTTPPTSSFTDSPMPEDADSPLPF